MIIVGERNWSLEYQKGDKPDHVWVYVKVKNEKIYFETFDDWLTFVKGFDHNSSSKIEAIGFQYKSHTNEKDATESNGVYLIKCIKGVMGGPAQDTYVTGIVKGDQVYKTTWSLPALLPEEECVEKIESCFEEALVNYGEEKAGVI